MISRFDKVEVKKLNYFSLCPIEFLHLTKYTSYKMKKFIEAPPILKTFVIISIIVVFGHFICLAFFSKGYLKLQPYIGSNSFMPYLFGALYFVPNKKQLSYDRIKNSITRIFIIMMIFSIIEIYFFDKLVMGVTLDSVIWYRIISVFVIPVLWIVLLSKKIESIFA